jgi:hypothetical protein
MLISFERDRLHEFEEQCNKDKISVSEGIRRLVEQELEKKELGECNPANIHYGIVENKPLQSDIRYWLPRIEAIKMIKQSGLSHQELAHISKTFSIAADRKRTGYL